MANPEIEIDTTSFDRLVLAVAAESSAEIVAEVVTDNPETEPYWPVLEHGSRPGARPWPTPRKKTTMRGGRIYSKQAPGGFVAKRFRDFLKYLSEAYIDRLREKQAPLSRAELIECANLATERAKAVIAAGAPVDSGKFKSSITMNPAK